MRRTVSSTSSSGRSASSVVHHAAKGVGQRLRVGQVELVELDDTTTYVIGVGRKFNENWSGSVSFTYEPTQDEPISPLAPVNGRKAITLAAIYTMDNVKISTGINYTKLGGPDLGVGQSGNKTKVAEMDDGELWGVGVRIGYSF